MSATECFICREEVSISPDPRPNRPYDSRQHKPYVRCQECGAQHLYSEDDQGYCLEGVIMTDEALDDLLSTTKAVYEWQLSIARDKHTRQLVLPKVAGLVILLGFLWQLVVCTQPTFLQLYMATATTVVSLAIIILIVVDEFRKPKNTKPSAEVSRVVVR